MKGTFYPLAFIGILGYFFLILYLLLSLFLIIRGLYIWRKNRTQITWSPYWNSKQLT